MEITTAKFLMSNTDLKKCPAPKHPEYAFIGRSNVGKSSLINMLTGRQKLAKISGKPGKTQLINHFLINGNWYLVDLPGYGFAKVSKSKRTEWVDFVFDYIRKRENLLCLFVLIDSRIPPQQMDLNFLSILGESGIPFVIVFTKTEKLTKNKLESNIQAIRKAILEEWEEMPESFLSSARSGIGKSEILEFIDKTNQDFSSK